MMNPRQLRAYLEALGPPSDTAFVTTDDRCSHCKSKLRNAETSRLEYQGQAFQLAKLLNRALHTGALRNDTHRALYIDICNALGIEPT